MGSRVSLTLKIGAICLVVLELRHIALLLAKTNRQLIDNLMRAIETTHIVDFLSMQSGT